MTTKELLHIQPPRDTHGFSKLAPDLVVEVPSRDERPGKVLAMCSRGAREVLAMCSRCAPAGSAPGAGWYGWLIPSGARCARIARMGAWRSWGRCSPDGGR
ncbi:MAG: hypothetical protein AMXMBFR55_31330 [Gemmatimonadota bacterium]